MDNCSGAVSNLLFPRDPVANASASSDIRRYPRAARPVPHRTDGQTWLGHADIGVAVTRCDHRNPRQRGDSGVLKVAVPYRDAALIVLQVSLVGAIEFDKARLYFFATLLVRGFCSSRSRARGVGRLRRRRQPGAVRRRIPSRIPPPLPFPVPQRLSITILDVKLAPSASKVTSHSPRTRHSSVSGRGILRLQRLSSRRRSGLRCADPVLTVPLHRVAEFPLGYQGIRCRRLWHRDPDVSGRTGSVACPRHGNAHPAVLRHRYHFDESWGSTTETPLPPAKALKLLREEIDKSESWRALPPPQGQLLVSLRKLDDAADGLVLHPVGVLRIQQKRIPLNLTISRVGAQKVDDAKRLSMAPVSGDLTKAGDPKERFAAARFNDYKDAEKLSRPAFGLEDSGIDLAPQSRTLFTGPVIKRIVRYELTPSTPTTASSCTDCSGCRAGRSDSSTAGA